MKYKRIKRRLILKKYILDFLGIISGCFVMATATSFFLLPNQLSTGGFAGIATIIYYIFNIPVGTVMLILNIPLLTIGFFRIGKEFLIKSVLGTILLSVFIDLLDKFAPFTQDRLLACIYGGILMGIGTGLILKVNASTGGTDLLSYLIRSYKKHFQSSNLIVIIDIIIVTLSVIVFRDVEVGLYSAIAIYLMGKMIDIIFEGVIFTKTMFIISPKYEEIARKISKKVNRGSTGIYAKGMFKHDDKMMLFCVGSRSEIRRIKDIATQIDKRAFIVISNAREIWGKGFKRE
jgi:uncharacterized membrane-anchored protein YitT (DUF2179 family)